MGITQSSQKIKIEFDPDRGDDTQSPEKRSYIVTLFGKKEKVYHLSNATRVRELMVPWGEFIFGEGVPKSITPQRYV